MNNLLKPCPFCASTDTSMESWIAFESQPGEHAEYAVMCKNCSAFGPIDLGWSGAEKMWNLRRLSQETGDG